MDYSKNLPNSLRARIIEQSRPLKPKKHIQIEKKDQSFNEFVERLEKQEKPKLSMLRQLRQQSDISLWNAIISQIQSYHQEEHGLQRTPRFSNISDVAFIEYLAQHPYSKKYLFIVHRGFLYVTLRHPTRGLYIVKYLFMDDDTADFLEFKKKIIRNEGIIYKIYDSHDMELPHDFPAVVNV